MLNLIRRAVIPTRARHSRKGRHRRSSMFSRVPSAAASAVLTEEPTAVLGRWGDHASHRYFLRGEDTALVRPYVLACEKSGQRRVVAVASHLPSEAWSALLGTR